MKLTEVKWHEAPRELLIDQLDFMAGIVKSRKGDDPTPISVGPFTGSYAELRAFFERNPSKIEMEEFAMKCGNFDEVSVDFESSVTIQEFKKLFPIPENIYWDDGRFETKSGFSESEEKADMYTNLLAGFISGLEACGKTTDFDVSPYCRNP